MNRAYWADHRCCTTCVHNGVPARIRDCHTCYHNPVDRLPLWKPKPLILRVPPLQPLASDLRGARNLLAQHKRLAEERKRHERSIRKLAAERAEKALSDAVWDAASEFVAAFDAWRQPGEWSRGAAQDRMTQARKHLDEVAGGALKHKLPEAQPESVDEKWRRTLVDSLRDRVGAHYCEHEHAHCDGVMVCSDDSKRAIDYLAAPPSTNKLILSAGERILQLDEQLVESRDKLASTQRALDEARAEKRLADVVKKQIREAMQRMSSASPSLPHASWVLDVIKLVDFWRERHLADDGDFVPEHFFRCAGCGEVRHEGHLGEDTHPSRCKACVSLVTADEQLKRCVNWMSADSGADGAAVLKWLETGEGDPWPKSERERKMAYELAQAQQDVSDARLGTDAIKAQMVTECKQRDDRIQVLEAHQRAVYNAIGEALSPDEGTVPVVADAAIEDGQGSCERSRTWRTIARTGGRRRRK